MGDGHVWLFAGSAVLLIDISGYGFKEWLAIVASLIGIGASIFGLWRGWRYSKSQIATRLLEYLQSEEDKIKEARNRIVRHLRWGKPLGGEYEHEFYRGMKAALEDQASGDARQAERALDAFANTLAEDIKVGQKFISNANLQLGTVFLVRGKSASARSQDTAARSAWEDALRCYPQDSEAERYLGELALAGGDIDPALDHFSRAYALAPDDKILKAETLESVAAYYQQQGRPRWQLEALVECAPEYAGAEAHSRAAAAYARAGEIAAQLNQNVQAPRLLRLAYQNYEMAGDRNGMRVVKDRLEGLGENVSDLATFESATKRPMPWPWIRLALELSILAAAAYLFFLTLR